MSAPSSAAPRAADADHSAAVQRHGDPEVIERLGLDAKAGRRRWIARAVVALVVAGGAGFGVHWYLGRDADAGKPKFATAPAVLRTIEVTVTATGTLRGLGTVEVGAEVSGKLIAVHVDWNDRVTKGQVIAEIDPEQLEAALAEATARVREADASVRQTEATRKETAAVAQRAQLQAGQGLVSKAELDTALAAAERAAANVESARASTTLARAALESARSRLAKTRIVSPIDGVVLSRLVEPGQTVTAGFQTPVLFRIAEDLRHMSLHVFIDEADIGRTREGQKASFAVDAYPGRVFPSSVVELRNEAKTEQNVVTYEAVLAVDNSESLLRPGMTATATIVAGRQENVLTVPNAALRFTPPREERRGLGPPPAQQLGARALGKKQVYVLRDGQPAPIEVVPGASDGSVTEIVSGKLSAGTEVIVDLVDEAKEPPK